ncbi:glutamate synthase subunit beta [Dichotomicrobium thermohalophilum]|uniref:Glutamate synthase (NADH) small subunit n=1 Tax=Dichotomicrobium thermohalophilum TaxID=933063 RepID=A0A397Q2K5_9HYPH|nr:glutamate synthase subunit beta [Dichotomicrobium thermohalophilum]RIA55596.1 glutamate synthase (NADH) small subunit [Dichotomicrobium thermohalophilum]
MGKVTGFLEIDRRDLGYEPPEERIKTFREFIVPLPEGETQRQAARCMDCGIPYCHTGCPVNNQIPDWNDLVYHGDWEEAARNLHSTNNFPEVTGRVCPAPCEAACTLNLEDAPVSIKAIEKSIADKAFDAGWVTPQPPSQKTGKRVAVIGSGPAGMAAAQQLARTGHEVHVYERNAHPGGLMRYGIPDFKMEKYIVERRVAQMEAEGVVFHCNTEVGKDIGADQLEREHDAVLLAGGAEHPRDLPIPGRELDGVHFAMDFLTQQNRRVSGEPLGEIEPITATGKHVIVIGGGDTGSDCIGTSFRQGAASVTQLEIMPKPPEKEDKLLTWPHWPLKLRTSSSQEEGAHRDWSVMTEKFTGSDGKVEQLHCVRVDENTQKIPGTEFQMRADLVLLAMGFVHPRHDGPVAQLGVELTERGNVMADDHKYLTSRNKIFVAGDMRRGQSLVVWAIREGRQAARAIDEFLMGESLLPR